MAAAPKVLRIGGTLPVTAQSPSEIRMLGAGADLADAVQVLFARDGAFDQRDVDVLGELLGVDQRPVDDVDVLRELDQALVQSRNDMWQPEQPSSQTVARRILAGCHRRPSRMSVRYGRN